MCNAVEHSRPDVSIIIPAHNSEKYLIDCIDSIRLHLPNNLTVEVLVILNGSTDTSAELINAYSIKYSWIKYWNLERSGRSYARNFGISKACGRYLMFLDADDFFVFGVGIKMAVKILDSNEELFAVWSDTIVRNGRQDSRIEATGFKYSDLENRNCFSISSVLIRNENLGRFPEDMYLYEDWVFWARSLKGRSVVPLNQVSSIVIHNEENTTARAVSGILTGQIRARARIRDLFPRRHFTVILRDLKKEVLYISGMSRENNDDSVLAKYRFSMRTLRQLSRIPFVKYVFTSLYNKSREEHLSSYRDIQ
ncbi:glycosyltransferase family 2 protein [Lacticaseibacillus baoqingensis]|uniref:Glycosyltransferase family 2 protein n=1 Tax=Lacticaseibacillus baoqingensis TaxID=2486013 RepID=A0ABW4E3E0_9LACO|nr:glycosyltransferase family A protein [Lacticaseibacillus baoqingensis]